MFLHWQLTFFFKIFTPDSRLEKVEMIFLCVQSYLRLQVCQLIHLKIFKIRKEITPILVKK